MHSLLDYLSAHPALTFALLAITGAAMSATSSACRLTHPRLSAWLGAFAAALPGDVARMSPGAAPPPVAPQAPPPAVDREAPTAKERTP